MGRGWLSVGALVVALFSWAAPVVLRAQAVQRSIYTSALDQSGEPVPNLGPADFVVREDKVAREILNVVPATDPMQIALLVDNSQAADPYTRDYREALPAFLNTIAADQSGAKHQVAIITLAERPTINTDYTFDVAQAVKGAQRIFSMPGSGAYLLDGIIETSQGIVKKGFTRPVMIAITTQGPEMSDREYMTVLERLRESGAAFHSIMLGTPRNNNYDRSVVLDMGTKDTGGRNDTLLTGTALTSRMKQVATELTHQYRVTYARPQTLIPPEQVTITSAKPGLTVRGTALKTARERQ
jgi:hypothetical protein